MKRKLHLKTAFLLLLGMATLNSCINDKFDYADPSGSNGESVTLQINVPASSQPKTRALSDADEYAVNDISVLAFNKTSKLFKGRYTGRVVDGPTHISGASATLKFEVSLPYGDYDLMIVANAHTILNSNAAVLNPAVGKTDVQVAAALQMSMTTSGWNSSSTNPTYMPMWGYVTNLNVPDNFPLSNPVNLTRMVAKVDIQLGGDLVDDMGVTTGDFKLQSVRVYNYGEQGRLIPDIDGAFVWTAVTQSVLANNQTPSLPSSFTKADSDTDYIDYDVASPYQALKNEIYLFEAPKGVVPSSGTGDYLENTCLVIGGDYNDSGDTTYYRIDFANSSTSGGVTTYNYLPILRNNSYTVTITGVSGDGHGTPEEALNSTPTNITAHILDWNNENITTIVTDGIYVLGVSQSRFEFSSDARTSGNTDNRLTIVTNHSGGWSATVWGDEAGTTGLSWLRLSSSGGNGNYPDGNEIYFDIDANTSGDDRTAYIHIKAGTLNYIVKIVQRYMYLKITDITPLQPEISTLSFNSKTSLIGTDPQPRQILVEWSPITENVTVAKTAGSPDLTWQTSYQTVLTGGLHVLTIDPVGITTAEVAGDPYISKTAKLTFTLGATSKTADLDIDQTHYALSATNFTAITASVLSGTGSVKSNAPWSATWATSLSAGSMTAPATSPVTNAGSESGISFPYTFTSGSVGKVIFTFVSTDPNKQFDPVTAQVDAVQLPAIPTVPDGGTAIFTGRTYVGAFWRDNQKGERLIRIPVGAGNMGNWAVQVLDRGGFAADDIIFNKVEYNEDTKAYTYTPSAPVADASTDTPAITSGASYLMGETTVAYGGSGTMDATNSIYFRVGLKTTNPSGAPRYARIVISYGGTTYSKNQVIWLRQGEAADYLMAPGDPITVDGNKNTNGNRTTTNTRKFSPYNTTSAALNDATGQTPVSVTDGGDFTKYPSQAGAFFLFANSNASNINAAYHPTTTSTNLNLTQSYSYTAVDWADPTYNTCPDGYTRPVGGVLGATSANNFAQSLLVSPASDGTTNNTWGYYADGFFDRLPIDANSVSNYANTSVRGTQYDVAYVGRLFFNPVAASDHYNASIFFPAAGYRNSATTVSYAGTNGYYWSGTVNDGNSGYALYVGSGGVHAANYYGNRNYGFSVRCVAE